METTLEGGDANHLVEEFVLQPPQLGEIDGELIRQRIQFRVGERAGAAVAEEHLGIRPAPRANSTSGPEPVLDPLRPTRGTLFATHHARTPGSDPGPW